MSCRYTNAKYMTIAEQITRRIRSGEFLTKEPFYSRDELARAYNISPGTARAVVRVLEDRGIIACRKGKRPVPADVIAGLDTIPVCKPVFFRDAFMAETPEYDYLAYCARNILMRRKIGLREQDSDMPEYRSRAELSAGDVAIVFPSPAKEKAAQFYPTIGPTTARIDLVIDQTESNAVS
ncbi:MAG: GntR family transcriptional regulator, partial [Lentisphaeria bacterium]|nr:GntR family transcriptional regulator [Lentisphaeria bacterium]